MSILSVFIVILFVSGCSSNTVVKDEKPSITVNETNSGVEANKSTKTANTVEQPYYNNYTVSLDIDTTNRIVSAVEKINYKNTSNKSLDNLIVNVYANAFRRDTSYLTFLPEFENEVYKYGKDYSTFKINTLTVNNKEVAFSLNDTVLKITPLEPIKPNEELEITLQFDCYVPKISHRFGGNESTMWFGNFIPSMAVMDKDGWNTSKYYPVGEPFYSALANYDVTITTPKNYTTVTSGVGKTSENGNKNITTVSARIIRDFAFSVSNQYKKDSITTKDGIAINFYYTYSKQKNVDRLLTDAKKSIEYYVDNIGSYPYQELDIAECELYYKGSMEYPMFIMVDKNFLENENSLDVYPYKFGFQWFNCIVGINQTKEGWLNNGITSFVQARINYSDSRIDEVMTKEYALLEDALSSEEMTSLLSTLSEYSTWNSYNNIEFRRSKLMIYSLYKKMGTSKFDELLKTYYSTFSFKTVTANDFIDLASEINGSKLDDFFDEWINDKELPEL